MTFEAGKTSTIATLRTRGRRFTGGKVERRFVQISREFRRLYYEDSPRQQRSGYVVLSVRLTTHITGISTSPWGGTS